MYSVILLAGGKGTRMNNDIPKQFLTLGGDTVINIILNEINKVSRITEIIIVCDLNYENLIRESCMSQELLKKIVCVQNGKTRQESVYNGLNKATNSNIVIHEAARPFVKDEDFDNLIDADEENVIYATPLASSVLNVDSEQGVSYLDRGRLINIQWPQKFNRDTLVLAHNRSLNEGKIFVEDAGMIAFYELASIKILAGNVYNIKLTTSLDMMLGELIYSGS